MKKEEEHEAYRVGWNAGNKRGLLVGYAEDKRDIFVLSERIVYLTDKYKDLYTVGKMKDTKITHLDIEIEGLKAQIVKDGEDIAKMAAEIADYKMTRVRK